MVDYKFFQSIISEHVKVVLDLPLDEISDFTNDIFKTLDKGGKIIFFGNGGSAAQASHWAEEFVGRFVKKRKSLPAIALGTNFSNITGIANDYGFDEVFSREIEALGDKKDLAVGISTSGNSPNVLKGLQTANSKKIGTWMLTGITKNKATRVADKVLAITSDKTANIQELHSLVIHMVLELIEREYA